MVFLPVAQIKGCDPFIQLDLEIYLIFFPLHLLKERKYDSISQRRNPKLKKQSEKKRATFSSLNRKLKTIPGNSLPNIAHENY